MQAVETNDADAFGFGVNPHVPYAYAGKRFDSDTGLIYFGQRYYDPCLGRWLTQDPAGSMDSSNLYQYVFNNPVRFVDPTGESVGGFLLGFGEMILGGGLMITGGVLEVATCGGFTVGLGCTTSLGIGLMTHGAYQIGFNANDFAQEIGKLSLSTTIGLCK
jgi:RHS repeat-associated protein